MFHSKEPDGPRTLRSSEIPIRSFHSLTTCVSNPLEISNSPTVAFSQYQGTYQEASSEVSQAEETSCMFDNPNSFSVSHDEKPESHVDSDPNKKKSKEPDRSTGHLTALKTSPTGSTNPLFSEGKDTTSNTMSTPNISVKKPHTIPTCISPSCLPEINSSSDPQVPIEVSKTPFYSFVILHSPEDQDNACRVCQCLNDFGVAGGTTFSESFEIPGNNPLLCTENAIEKCAYIIILLTKHFPNSWTIFQSNTALMNSIEDVSKRSTVIPFLPRIDRLEKNKIPLCLKTLTALDETSPIFQCKVRNTFKLDEKQIQCCLMTQQMQRMQLERQSNNLNRYTNPGTDINQKSPHAPFTIPPSNQAMQGVGSFQQPSKPEATFAVSGQPTIFNITAENVQIGNSNMMNVRMVPSDCCGENDETSYACESQEGNGEGENIEQDRNARH